jgi:hydrogenase assembly chaperone HypC/HupF
MSDEAQRAAGGATSHPGGLDLVGAGGWSCTLDAEGHCITCSDEATPARIVNLDLAAGIALVEMAGQTTEVDVTLVDAAAPGDWLLVHGGVAIGNLEAREEPAGADHEQR